MVRLRQSALVLAFLTLAPVGRAKAAPPPPLLPGQEALSEKLVHAFVTKKMADYAPLLADDVQVYEDGTLVAKNKAEWLKRFGAEFVAEGVVRSLSPGYASAGRLLFIEYVNSLGSWGPGPPPDCCWRYQAVAYDVADGRVRVIRQLSGGALRLGPDGRVAGY